MTQFYPVDLGQEGLNYVHLFLMGTSGMADAASHLSIQSGTATTIIHAGISPERILEFDHGGIEPDGEEWVWLHDRFQHLKAEHNDCSLIVQNLAAKYIDPCIAKSKDKMFFHQERVYYYLDGNDFSAENISSTFYASTSYPLVGFFLKCGVSDELQRLDITDKQMRGMFEHVVEIYISAYDRESFIAWSHRDTPIQYIDTDPSLLTGLTKPVSNPGDKGGYWWDPVTGRCIHYDYDHGPPYGKHVDCIYPKNDPEAPHPKGYRWYPDGRMIPIK